VIQEEQENERALKEKVMSGDLGTGGQNPIMFDPLRRQQSQFPGADNIKRSTAPVARQQTIIGTPTSKLSKM